MSRQIRMQIPQKQKKKRVDRNVCLLVFILIFSGILTFILLTARDNNKLNSTLDETFDFVKTRIESYEIYNTNDQVKSLVRLLDKTTELSRVIEQEGNFSTEILDEYAREQRLTGILVLDQNLKVTEQNAKDEDTMQLWQKLIKSDYVRDIAEHSEKTYTTRLRNKGKIYDFAAVARRDAAGILITYAQKEEVNELNGDLTMASLFSDFPFEMNGSVVICDDDKVVSTNRQELTARSIEEAKSRYINKFKADENGIVCLRSEAGNWSGRREKIKDYDAYIFFPESQVYITRNIICVIYVLLALLLFLLYRVSRSRTEKRSILQDQKRLRVINALGHAYSSISLVNLKTEEIEIVKSSGNMKPDQKGDIFSKAHQEELIRQVIAEPFQEAYWKFVDISTVAKRLEERETLSFTARTVDERWLTMIIVPQGYDKDGKLCTVLVANRDVTEEKEREIAQDRNLRNALAAAEDANRAKTVFLNNMSHDIRTPMNAVLGFTALATAHIDNKELVLDYLKKIHISGQHLLSLINDVLDMSKIESSEVCLNREEIYLPDLIAQLKSIMDPQTQEHHQTFVIHTDEMLYENLIGDAVRLRQVFLNLLSNAVKYTPDGGTITLDLTQKKQDKNHILLAFTVTDTGYGMTPDFVQHIFEPFTRAEDSTTNKIQGTGLGMAITKSIVDLMSGTITLQSEPGKGSSFFVTVLLEIAQTALVHSSTEKNDSQTVGTILQGMKFLCAEDNALNAEILEAILEMEGADCTIYPDGRQIVEAFAQVKPGEYDAILMDMQMPVMNGLEATAAIRNNKNQLGKTIPIIAMTANAFSSDVQACLDAGMNAHLSKPLEIELLKQTMKSISRPHKEQHE